MSIVKEVSFPTDEDGFLRRACPFCKREFKVKFKQEEISDISQRSIENYLLESQDESHDLIENEDSENKYFCPYCGQQASFNDWWTEEQGAYIQVILKNIMADLVNAHLIKPLQRSTRSSSFIKVNGKPMKQQEEWISPEINDMKIFELPCCERKIKTTENWKKIYIVIFVDFAIKYMGKPKKFRNIISL